MASCVKSVHGAQRFRPAMVENIWEPTLVCIIAMEISLETIGWFQTRTPQETAWVAEQSAWNHGT